MQIITINREFGSGGREFGKRLAKSLKCAYYDRQIIEELSQKLTLDKNYLERTLDTDWANIYNFSCAKTLTTNKFTTQNSFLLAEQHKLVKKLAEQSDCVVVGSNADVILADMKPLRIFVYADINSKITRCREREIEMKNLSEHAWVKKIKAIDKGRASKHELVSAIYPWGDKRGYDLCINTSGTSIEKIIPAMKQFVTAWFKEHTNGN